MNLGMFFHRLFHVHCAECRTESECPNCNLLRDMLADERREKKELLEKLTKEPEKIVQPEQTKVEVRQTAMPWRVRQQILEAEDRRKAQVLREVKSTEELEKELLPEAANADK